jgi:hypothetical protein
MLITIDVMGEEDDITVDYNDKDRKADAERNLRLAKEEWIRRNTQTRIIEIT